MINLQVNMYPQEIFKKVKLIFARFASVRGCNDQRGDRFGPIDGVQGIKMQHL